MAANNKPIPSLYTVYILRSTVRHASLYIGSTPNPPRRLKQHNGEAKGGAARTCRPSLRPWEMVGLVSGFPSLVGALKFEWALTNPHISLHIPFESRISVTSGRKRNGMPKRPRSSLNSILQNVHLLLRVASFSRWPLKLHFFAPEVYDAWKKLLVTISSSSTTSSAVPLRASLDVLTDFGPKAAAVQSEKQKESALPSEDKVDTDDDLVTRPWGIHALPLKYEDFKDYVSKGRSVFGFEREGKCVICDETLDDESQKGLLALCSNDGCEGVGHLTCWSQRFLQEKESSGAAGFEEIVPIQGTCPCCGGMVKWGDMMKELTLRTRGQKEVDKILKPKRKPRKPAEARPEIEEHCPTISDEGIVTIF
ncbi:hypothetical protein MCOR06_002655 [Pyricularia oryzae]|nr:hypothetical protein MCOR06_002655 [Pyricularia oryzae]